MTALPPGKRAIGCKWVFRRKRKADGSIERYKARLVAQGFSQRPGFEYGEIFAPTIRMSTMRLILAQAALEDLHMTSIDISHAFINGDLDEEIYMKPPPGFKEGDWGEVLHLLKSLYGLKQSARRWNKKLHSALQDLGFNRIRSDPSLYVYERGEVRIYMPVYVDDITIVSRSQPAIDQSITDLSKSFKLRNLGPTTFLLGIEIIRDRPKCTLQLSQRQYILDILSHFGMADCNPVSTPMEPGLSLTASMAPETPEEQQEMRGVPYLSAVGSLMYLAMCTRPDIAYTVGVLARFGSSPGVAHWKAVKHLFRYLQGTLDLKLTYRPDASCDAPFTTYTDADHGGDKDTGRSTGGYIVKVGTGAVSWSSKQQAIVTLSTTEAEFVAAVEAGKEIFWMRNILSEMRQPVGSASRLYIDNRSAISVAKNPEHHGRMKHLDLCFFWLRDAVEAGTIEPVHLRTDEMPADLLTKALPRVKVELFRRMMGLE